MRWNTALTAIYLDFILHAQVWCSSTLKQCKLPLNYRITEQFSYCRDIFVGCRYLLASVVLPSLSKETIRY